MAPGFRAFMSGLIDYAGLFPPAKLPLDPAIRNYVRYRTEPEAWMLGRFICPAARLGELRAYQGDLFRQGPPFAFSVLGRGGETPAEFLAGLDADLAAIAAFRQTHGERVTAEVLEVRLPAAEVELRDADAVRGLLNDVAARVEAAGPPRLALFFEAPLGTEWRDVIGGTVRGIADYNATSTPARVRCGPAGFKLRCGGVDASAFPSAEQVAFALTACRDAGIALKATAGLHHPIRRFDGGVQSMMHGFFNVFGAGMLAHAHGLDESAVRAILEDESAESFSFKGDTFSWKGMSVSRDEIERARAAAVTTFGSCSFDEPREDLKALRLL